LLPTGIAAATDSLLLEFTTSIQTVFALSTLTALDAKWLHQTTFTALSCTSIIALGDLTRFYWSLRRIRMILISSWVNLLERVLCVRFAMKTLMTNLKIPTKSAHAAKE